jgi:hypothetical protein
VQVQQFVAAGLTQGGNEQNRNDNKPAQPGSHYMPSSVSNINSAATLYTFPN